MSNKNYSGNGRRSGRRNGAPDRQQDSREWSPTTDGPVRYYASPAPWTTPAGWAGPTWNAAGPQPPGGWQEQGSWRGPEGGMPPGSRMVQPSGGWPQYSNYAYGRDGGDGVPDQGGDHDHDKDMACCGPHAGRGPRSYRRSDERIEEDINERLSRHGLIDATEIEVSVADGVVTLTGSVDDRNAKRIAEDLAEDSSGVKHVVNQLRARSGKAGSSRSDESTAGDGRRSSRDLSTNSEGTPRDGRNSSRDLSTTAESTPREGRSSSREVPTTSSAGDSRRSS